MVRVVADTNVLVSAVIADGKPRELLRLCIRGDIELVLSPGILDEVRDVLHRPKFSFEAEEVHRVLRALVRTGRIVETRSSFEAVEADPDDDMVIHAAVDGGADVIVSGDGHLLGLERCRGVRIRPVAAFLEDLEAPS